MTCIPSRGETKNSKSCHAAETRDKHWPDGPLGSYVDFPNLPFHSSQHPQQLFHHSVLQLYSTLTTRDQDEITMWQCMPE